jgi:V8-like Glu-specific endopeptidase
MVRFCQYILNNGPENFGLAAQDAALLQNLIDQTRDRAAALLAHRSVGRVEDALEQGIGTGAVIAQRTLLVCGHVISKTRVESAWVRFGYTSYVAGQDKNALFELDLSPSQVASGSHGLDYALVRINGQPKQPVLPTLLTELNSGDEVRMIHHPAGKPAVVSDVGRVTHVANDYILHDLPAQHGSSGAPIFNRHWQLVAIHRGESARTQPGTAEGLPLSAFWLELQKHLAPSTGV